MTENFATLVATAADSTGPGGLVSGPFRVRGTNAMVRSRPVTMLTRKDPWRSTVASRVIVSQPVFAWAMEVGDSEASDVVLDAIGDPDRGEESGGTRTWRVGRASDVRRFSFHADLVEGGDVQVQRAGLASAQLVVERGRMATWTTEWIGREADTTAPAWTVVDQSNEAFATAATTTVTIDDEELPVFSAGLQISRDLQAANFSHQGIASAWAGNLAFDVVGRVAARLDATDAVELMTGQILTRSIALTMVAGTRTRVITIPNCACEIRERRLVGPGTYEHLIDFAVIRNEGEDLMTITSTAP